MAVHSFRIDIDSADEREGTTERLQAVLERICGLSFTGVEVSPFRPEVCAPIRLDTGTVRDLVQEELGRLQNAACAAMFAAPYDPEIASYATPEGLERLRRSAHAVDLAYLEAAQETLEPGQVP